MTYRSDPTNAVADEAALILQERKGPMKIRELLKALAQKRRSFIQGYVAHGLTLEDATRQLLEKRPGLFLGKAGAGS